MKPTARARTASHFPVILMPFLLLSAVPAWHAAGAQSLTPGNLVVSRSVYAGTAASVTIGQTLPPGCVPSTVNKVTCGAAITNGTYPYVFNNSSTDGSFGITSPLFLDELTPGGSLLNTLAVPNNTTTAGDGMVTSFSSKSEGALHLSTDGTYLTFMDYVAAVNTVDVSNSNTALAPDPTNAVPAAYYRAAATVNAQGQFSFTETNAYSGNNGRSTLLVNTNGNNFFYSVGNAGNGGTPEPQNVVLGAGLQLIPRLSQTEASQTPGLPMPVGSFDVSELPNISPTTDKVGKDDNFRGETLYNNVLYVTKGSGGNGTNTVYFVDTTGTACPQGTGLPVAGAPLPTTNLAPTYNATTGLANNMCILAGFPTAVNKLTNPVAYPFALFFANPTTLYVADEGNGTNTYDANSNTYSAAAASTNTGGLQKWTFNASTQQWQLAYTLKIGLKLGIPYTVPGYPTGFNGGAGGTNLPFAPASDGLRNLIGSVQGNRIQGYNVVIWAISSTVSGSGDQGADPNKLYIITDRLASTSPNTAAQESFTELRSAGVGEVLRGVSFTPGTPVTSN